MFWAVVCVLVKISKSIISHRTRNSIKFFMFIAFLMNIHLVVSHLSLILALESENHWKTPSWLNLASGWKVLLLLLSLSLFHSCLRILWFQLFVCLPFQTQPLFCSFVVYNATCIKQQKYVWKLPYVILIILYLISHQENDIKMNLWVPRRGSSQNKNWNTTSAFSLFFGIKKNVSYGIRNTHHAVSWSSFIMWASGFLFLPFLLWKKKWNWL